MGEALAKKLIGFDCKVIAYDKYKKDYSDNYTTEVSLEELFKQTDILSIHLPLSEETKHYVNAIFLNDFKKNIYVINTARGNNIKTEDLITALQSGKVLGACLDVLEFESKSFELEQHHNQAFEYLKNAENVILSPHVAGWTRESYQKLAEYLANKIEIFFRQNS